jgi:UDP-glucuronate 4-epimerase
VPYHARGRIEGDLAQYVVTGCAGFIGSHLTDALLERGHSVRGVDCFTDYYPRPLKDQNLASALASARFALYERDLVEEAIDDLVAGAAGIFHLAAQPGVRGSWGESFESYARNNVVATQKVLEAAAEAGVRVILASSSSVYGETEVYPTSEDVALRPVSPYGVTKATCEQLAYAYRATAGLDATVLRYFSVYGPRQRPDMAFARIADAFHSGEPFVLLGTGGQSRDFTYVGDAVSATLAALDAPAGHVYNVGGGAEVALRDVVSACERLARRRLPVRQEGVARGDVRRTAADTARIRSELGWQPETPLEQGLELQLRHAGVL